MNSRPNSIPLCIGAWLLTTVFSLAAEPASSAALRPKTLFNLDFEVPASRFPQTSKVDSQAANHQFSSKRLIIGQGDFSWSTGTLDLPNPMLTRLSVDVTSLSGPEGFHRDDYLKIYVDYGYGDRPLSDLLHVRSTPTEDVLEGRFHGVFNYHVIGDSSGQNRTFKGSLPLGELVRYDGTEYVEGIKTDYGITYRPWEMKIVVEASVRNPGSYFAIDNLVVHEENLVVDDYDPESFNQLEPPREFVISGSDFDADTPSIEFDFDYHPEDLTMDLREAESDDICLGDIFPRNTDDLLPLTLLGVQPGDEGLLRASFRLNRPPDGWNSLDRFVFGGVNTNETPLGNWENLTRNPRLFQCGQELVPLDQKTSHGRWSNFADPGVVLHQTATDDREAFEREFANDPIRAGFYPLGTLDGNPDTYSFRVLYESRDAPFDLTWFDRSHIALESFRAGSTPPERHYPEIMARKVRHDGHHVVIDYRLTKPLTGWPMGFFAAVEADSVRDLQGNILGKADFASLNLATIGRDIINEEVQTKIVGGRLIEGDPDRHRITLLWRLPEDFGDDRRGVRLSAIPSFYYGWFNYHLLLGGQDSPLTIAPLVKFVGVSYEPDSHLLSFIAHRPADGWPKGELQVALQTVGLRNPHSYLPSGSLLVTNSEEETALLADEDYDGMSLAEERLAGTDPTNPQSNFSLLEVVPTTKGRTLTWSSVPNRFYHVQFSTDLRQWINLNGQPIPGREVSTSFQDRAPEQLGRAQGYYRIITTKPLQPAFLLD
ncbi:MAG: hypothetical protein AAF514_07980 [Verrucomicrobiota bacterium]